ncbi:MAG: S-layer homology domain-containing protein [Clostridiales Family XIII bacterium]|nr:S-layer homology domain-containing protein [Clostridiales Family XIII bacterium]
MKDKRRTIVAVLLVAFMACGVAWPTVWAAPSRTVAYNLNGAAGDPPQDSTVYSATPYRATIMDIDEGGADVTPPAGKRFAGWSPVRDGVANEWYAPGKQVIVSQNGLELYAMWVDEKPEYAVKFRTKFAGLEVAPQTVSAGGLVTEPAPLEAQAGYSFVGWYRDSSFRFPWNFVEDRVDSDLMLHAKWAQEGINPWKVTYHLDTAAGVVGVPPVDNTTYSLQNGNARVKNIESGTTLAGKVFAGWSTSPKRVLELKYRPNNVSDYVAVKQEGIDLYDVWVDADPTYSNAITVDFSDERQTMAGLGNAMAFNRTSGYLQIYEKFKRLGVPDAENPAIRALHLTVDDKTGAKLNIFRAIIGDGGVTAPDINPQTGEKYEWGNRYYDGPSDTIWPEPGEGNIVWNRPDWNTQKDKFDVNQIWYIKKAMEINPDLKVYGASWSPPYWMKTNLGVRNDTPDNPNGQPKTTYPLLHDAYYEDYAKYLCEYAWGMWAWYGIPIYAVSPTNEPEIDHGYSAMVIRGDDYERFLLDYLKPMIQKYKDEGKFGATPTGGGSGEGAVAPVMGVAAPEATRIDRSTSPVDLGTPDRPGYGGMMAKDEIADMVDVFTTHMYENDQFLYEPRVAGDDDPIYPALMNKYEGKDIWMTEIGQQFPPYNEQNVADNFTMINGLFWARRISNEFASEPGFTSYILWNGMSSAGVTNDGARWINMLNAGSGQGTLPSLTGQMRIYKRYYTVAQFSRFINPGDIRVGADRVPFKGANVTAYKSADGNDFSIVALNEDNVSHSVTIRLNGNGATKLVPYRTSDRENMRKLETVSAIDGVFTVNLPAMSMTTFVNDKGAANLPGMDMKDIFTILEAEDNDGQSRAVATTDGLSLTNGGYIKYSNFNFADGTGIPSGNLHVLRMIANGKADGEGKLEIRLGSVDGKVVGAFPITRSSEAVKYYAQLDTGDLGAYGFKDFYLLYRGEGEVTLNNFTFDSVQMDATNFVVNGSLNNTANWTGKNATLTANNALYYRGTSLLVSSGGSDTGAEADLRTLTASGIAYKLNAFVIPTIPAYNKSNAYEPGFVDAGVAEARLQFYDGGSLVESRLIASRGAINNIDWKQLTGTFVYNPPTVAFDSVKLLFTMPNYSGSWRIDEVTLTRLTDAELSDADLVGISVSAGTLAPAFALDTLVYDVQVAYGVNYVTIGAVAANAGAVVNGLGKKTLNVGLNTFAITVTSIDGKNTKTYTIKVTRNSGYLNGGAGGTVTSSATTTQPAITITPGAVAPLDPGPAEGALSKFTDASGISAWALPYLEKLVQGGIISGYTDGSLGPKRNVTRAEFTKMIVSALKIASGEAAKSFVDVAAGDWYKEFVDIASACDIVKGVSETSFAPNSNITRQDLATIAYRALIFSKTSLSTPDGNKFADDASIADYAKDAVYTLKKLQIVSGRDDGNFDPAAFATREETAKIISGVMDYVAVGTAEIVAEQPETTEPVTSDGSSR